MLEGGINTISVVLQNVSQDPPIPIVVVAGSGRAADLITFAVTDISSNGYVKIATIFFLIIVGYTKSLF